MNQRIDLSTAPSAMEAAVAQWTAKGPGAKPMRPSERPAGYQPFPKAPVPRARPLPPPDELPSLRNREEDRRMEVERQAYLDARRDAMRDITRIIAPPEPDPAVFVMRLTKGVSEALVAATRCKDPEVSGHYEVQPSKLVQQMYDMGLLARIGKHHRILSAFAVAVRREIMKDIG